MNASAIDNPRIERGTGSPITKSRLINLQRPISAPMHRIASMSIGQGTRVTNDISPRPVDLTPQDSVHGELWLLPGTKVRKRFPIRPERRPLNKFAIRLSLRGLDVIASRCRSGECLTAWLIRPSIHRDASLINPARHVTTVHFNDLPCDERRFLGCEKDSRTCDLIEAPKAGHGGSQEFFLSAGSGQQ